MSSSGGSESGEDDRPAIGGPGDDPRWAPGDKVGVGSAISPGSSVWFALGRGGLEEIFYPGPDRPCVRDLGLIVADEQGFASHDREPGHVEQVAEIVSHDAPLYRLKNTCNNKRYRIEKTILAHPRRSAVLQRTRFEPLDATAGFRLFAVLNPHVDGLGGGNTAWSGVSKGEPALFASRGPTTIAMVCSPPWKAATVGYLGGPSGWEALWSGIDPEKLPNRAEDGNVAMTAEVDLRAGDGRFTIALGFGPDPDSAAYQARAALLDDFDALTNQYNSEWRSWGERLDLPEPPDGGGRDLRRLSATVIRSLGAAREPGAFVASLATPWGAVLGDERAGGTGGYHMVWPRDLCESAGGLLAVGAKADASSVLRHLRVVQGRDGHWPQNMRADGSVFRDADQLGQTAFPILLLDHLRRESAIGREEAAGFRTMARRAAAYLVRHGPDTDQDRWENEAGYAPFTLALAIPALLIVADLVEESGESGPAGFLRELADAWNGSIERWLYVSGTELAREHGADGYYARIVPATPPQARVDGGYERSDDPEVRRDRELPPEEVVSPDALALVRYGLRSPDDPHILESLKVIDAVLKAETSRGPAWRRYDGDGYGEHEDGTPYRGDDHGIGRAWPILTGERGHYELAAGRPAEAARLLRALAEFAGPTGMLPEQVWDAEDIPEHGLHRGRPNGSAMPLAWSHAEYLKLARSIALGRIYDRPPRAALRYLENRTKPVYTAWKPGIHPTFVLAGTDLRVLLPEPGAVSWELGRARPRPETVDAVDTSFGVHAADLPTRDLPVGATVRVRPPGADDPIEFEVC